MNPGSIDQNNLSALVAFLRCDIDDAEDTVARGLRLGRNDRNLFADQRVQQGAFARVRASEDAGESGVEGHETLGYSLMRATVITRRG